MDVVGHGAEGEDGGFVVSVVGGAMVGCPGEFAQTDGEEGVLDEAVAGGDSEALLVRSAQFGFVLVRERPVDVRLHETPKFGLAYTDP